MTDQRPPVGQAVGCDEVREQAAAFVLGALETDEAATVRAHLASCPERHGEFQELAAVLEVLAESVPQVEPPASLGPRIRAAAAADPGQRVPSPAADVRPRRDDASAAVDGDGLAGREGHAARRSPMGRTGTVEPWAMPALDPAVVPGRGRPPALRWGLRIAAGLAIVVLGGWNLLLQGQLSAAQRYEQDVAAVLQVAGQDEALIAVLTPEGDPTGPSGLAAVTTDGSIRLAMRGLAPTAGSEVYEAWIIASDGVPRPVGSLTVDASGVASLRADGATASGPVEPGIVLALTREPAPGATTPTLPIVSVGTARAG